MKKFMKKLALVLSFVMVFTALPMNVFAATTAKAIVSGVETSFATLQEAITAADEGTTVTLTADITSTQTILVNKAITIDGANHKYICNTADSGVRAFNVDVNGSVAIKNLTIETQCPRAINIINKAATVLVENVTATTSNYGVYIAPSAGAAKVTIEDCNFTGLATIYVCGVESEVVVNDTKLVCNDTSEEESYGAITIWDDDTNSAMTVTVNGGEIVVSGDSKAAAVYPKASSVTFNNVTGNVETIKIVAMIGVAGYETLEEAVEDATDSAATNSVIEIMNDVETSGVMEITRPITINENGHNVSATIKFADESATLNTDATGVKVVSGVVGKEAIVSGGKIVLADCDHENTVSLAEVKATCTVAGLTTGTLCGDCNEITVPQQAIPATGHTFASSSFDADKHYYKCTCGETYLTGAHEDVNKDTVCEWCGYVMATFTATTTSSRVNPNTGVTAEMLG